MKEEADNPSGAQVAPVPKEWQGKALRCCITCQLLKTFDQFYEQGCDNCPFLEMEGDAERIYDSTTTEFQGMAAVVDPAGSWGAKWLHLKNNAPGCYALGVKRDALPQHILDILEAQGIQLKQD